MGKIDEFWKALTSEEGKELLNNAKAPENEEETAELYSSIAEKLGVKAPKGDVLNLLKAKEKVQQSLTEKAAGLVKKALDDDQLTGVAGGAELEGKQATCESTFIPGEWCWASDSCSVIITDYSKVANNPNDDHALDDVVEIADFENDTGFALYGCDSLLGKE